ncbi:DUF2200 family protein [Streptococcus sp. X16XC17]|uniref:DUF2200 family protein n=1 Tax=Streptococcus sp. X16XC17 TaxID=2316646 RepID=UPI001039A267|nr:DUF2200 family protein [Streptococcus sp. X16XC17]TCD46627.1 DUF2200 family protein [Streptococcus sp. X16XC17]
MSHRLYQMSFASVFQALIKKIERKGHDSKRVYAITSWLTGYSIETIKNLEQTDLTYGQFFQSAPAYHPKRINITGKICGIQIEGIEDPLMQEIRRLDKLVDWLAKGKTVQQVIEKYTK